MSLHLVFFGYMFSTFFGLAGVALVLLILKHGNTVKAELYHRMRDFIFISFLAGGDLFLQYYQEKIVMVYEVNTFWRVLDYTFWICLFYQWVRLMDVFVGNGRHRRLFKVFASITLCYLLFSVSACIFLMDAYYYISNDFGRIILTVLNISFATFFIIVVFIYVIEGMGELTNFISRFFCFFVSAGIGYMALSQSLCDARLYFDSDKLSGWQTGGFDPQCLVLAGINLVTILFIYKMDFSPVYSVNSEKNKSGCVSDEFYGLSIIAEKHRLTHREYEVLLLAYKGYSNPDIALELMISRNTVKRHMHNIFEKLDISTRMELFHLANTQNRAEVRQNQ